MKKIIKIILIIFVVLLDSCSTPSYIFIESEPVGAEVYLLSKYKYETKGTSAFMTYDSIKSNAYPINEGPTPVLTKQKTKVYKIILVYDSIIETREVDLDPNDTTYVKVILK